MFERKMRFDGMTKLIVSLLACFLLAVSGARAADVAQFCNN